MPIGPALVTADEIADPQAIELTCHINGELRRRASTASMALPVARIIAELSTGTTLFPGDIVLTGTPAGVGYARTPPSFLTHGDQVVVEATKMGSLKNRAVVHEGATLSPN